MTSKQYWDHAGTILEPFQLDLGGSLGCLGRSLEWLGVSGNGLGKSWAALGRLGAVLALSWTSLGQSWVAFEIILGPLGPRPQLGPGGAC